MEKVQLLFLITLLTLGALAVPQEALAHRSGCHNLHTCPSDANTYVCGDLGFPCDGSTSLELIDPKKIAVPLVVEKAFDETFGRTPSETESAWWKKRWRADKDGLRKLRAAMAWHKEHDSFGPKVSASTARARLIKEINTIFSSVYDGRLPTPSESQYWITRTADKTTTDALRGAMAYHKANGIAH